MSANEPILQTNEPEGEAPQSSKSAHFALAERAAKIGYWRYEFATQKRIWSPGMYVQLGLEPRNDATEVSARHQELLSEDLENVSRIVDEAIETGRPFHYRSRMVTKDGEERIFETHGEVECGPDGKPSGIIGVRHDITELVAAETARHRAEEMYRVMAEQASDIIILYDSNMEPIYASPAFGRMLGRPPAEASGKSYRSIIHPDDLAEAVKLERTPDTGETVTATFRARHRDGHHLWLESSTRAICDSAGNVQNVISVSRDVTERLRREFEIVAALERAEAANLAKSTFLANMSHELRTPLNAIIGFADMMRQQMFGPLGAPRYAEYAQLIHESGELLLDLISDVLDMAKIEAGKLQLHVENVELRGLVHDCVRLLEERASGAGVELQTDLPPGAIPLEGDRRALKQILLNLISNAVKFTMPGGKVKVRACLGADKLTLAVIDDGIGIPAHALSRLGRPFEQVSNDPTVSKGGTGLGLALVHALAGKHGGKARIESEEGVGTTVTVELPLRQDARAAA